MLILLEKNWKVQKSIKQNVQSPTKHCVRTQRKKGHTLYDITYMWNLKDTNECI